MNVGIAGAGLMGRLIALLCLERSCHVSIFDQDAMDNSQSCGVMAAGMLSPAAELEKAEPQIYEWGMKSLQLWPQILKRLDAPVPYSNAGSWVLAHASDVPELERFYRQLRHKLPEPLAAELRLASREEMSQSLPEVNVHQLQGFYLKNEASIDAAAFFQALTKTLFNKGIQWYPNETVETILPGKIVLKNAEHSFDWVFDCRGMGAQSSFSDLRAVRGELIHLEAPEVSIPTPIRLMHPRFPLYIVPKDHHRYIIGASEIESDDRSPISVRTILELLTAAYSVHSGFAEARVLKTSVNCRPTFSDHLPKIKIDDGVVAINGLYRHGYLCAPVIAQQVMDTIFE